MADGPALAAVSERNPDIRIFALETTVSRFSDAMWVMQQILSMSMDKRLDIFLLDKSARIGSDTLKLTHEQIARYMGSAREVVSRMLKYFVNEGIVEAARGGVTILGFCDMVTLMENIFPATLILSSLTSFHSVS